MKTYHKHEQAKHASSNNSAKWNQVQPQIKVTVWVYDDVRLCSGKSKNHFEKALQ